MDKLQILWLIVGAVLALLGGVLKIHELLTSPAVFEYVFFSGGSYIMMVTGLAVLIVALGYDLLMGQGEEQS